MVEIDNLNHLIAGLRFHLLVAPRLDGDHHGFGFRRHNGCFERQIVVGINDLGFTFFAVTRRDVVLMGALLVWAWLALPTMTALLTLEANVLSAPPEVRGQHRLVDHDYRAGQIHKIPVRANRPIVVVRAG